jgi:hypothetical protein
MKARIGRHKVDRIEALPKNHSRHRVESASSALHSISPAARARQDRQRRQCRHCTRDGGLHLVDRLHDSIRAKDRNREHTSS